MNINLLHEKLIRAARATPSSTRVPYAYEKRIMARIQDAPILDAVTLWARALWRAAIPCVAVALLLAVWATHTPGEGTPGESTDLGTELESTLMASVSFENDLAW